MTIGGYGTRLPNALRFGVVYRFLTEWSRLEPEEGAWEEGPLKEYSKMVDDLISRGIAPWSRSSLLSPSLVGGQGGFSNAENIPDL